MCILVAVLDMVLLALMVHYTSWLFMLGFVFISGLTGAWLVNDGLRRYLSKVTRSVSLEGTWGDEVPLLGAAARLAAGALFIVPGVLTDVMALALISPWGKWLVRSLVGSLFAKTFSGFADQGRSVRSNGERPAKDEIIDVRIVDSGERDEKSES